MKKIIEYRTSVEIKNAPNVGDEITEETQWGTDKWCVVSKANSIYVDKKRIKKCVLVTVVKTCCAFSKFAVQQENLYNAHHAVTM